MGYMMDKACRLGLVLRAVVTIQRIANVLDKFGSLYESLEAMD
jgi:hypothetical protein